MSTVQDTSSVSSLFGAGAATSKSGTEATKDRFLTLLVAQMKNQDPLNPLDNAQVTSQMAQLSTVQGIETMNSNLQALAASLGTNQMSQAASLIGHAVLVPGNTTGPGAVDNVMGFELSRPADAVTLNIKDAAGKVVRSLDLGPTDTDVKLSVWDGLTSDGQPAPEGSYTFTIDAVQGGRPVTATTLHLGAVNSVSQTAAGVQLNLAGAQTASYADIRQIF